jgi:two-component system chemotaxis sensor kinase CheA
MSSKLSSQLAQIEEMQELVNDFIHESLANLERTEQLVESLGTDDIWLIEQNIRVLFRTFHSIKGVAGFLQLAVLQALTHEAETLLDGIRKRPVRQSEEVLQTIYRAFDGIRAIIRAVEQHKTDVSTSEMADALIAHIQQFIMPDERIDLDGNVVPQHTPLASAAKTDTPKDPPLATPPAELTTSEIEQIHRKAHLLLDELHHLAEREKLHAQNPALLEKFLEDGRECVERVNGLINELQEESRLPADAPAMTLAQSALVFSDMMAAGDLALNDVTLLTLQSQVASFVEVLREDIAPHADSATAPVIEPSVLLDPLPDSLLDVQTAQQNTTLDDQAKTFDGATTYTDRSEIRVETAKLDRLFDLMSELVTLQTMTLNNPDLHNLNLPNFQKSAAMLAKNIRQLQGVTMSMRMTPIEILFAKMKRVTREVATHVGKRVELTMSGADTEMDKNVIELMFDPLVHIIRNAIDHGIESPAERERLGKPATGVIHLGAMYEGNEILITVRDDGAGLNRKKILQRAMQRGLVQQNAESLTDEEVWKCIFEPGFSTAEAVTDVSGRGVGMDVVKQNIAKMRGSVQVRSREGKGATVTLRIPLTLASMDVILVRVGRAHYAIPVGAVRQSFRPSTDDITTTMDGLEVVRVRETLYTIVRLHEIFQHPAGNTAITSGILVIVETNGRKVCLFVDEIVGQQQTVIKPLAKYIGDVRGLNGCMILSDGTIGLILDVEELIRIAEEPAEMLA